MIFAPGDSPLCMRARDGQMAFSIWYTHSDPVYVCTPNQNMASTQREITLK